jgi:hypothetical protein
LSWRNTQEKLDFAMSTLDLGKRTPCPFTKNHLIWDAQAMIKEAQRDIAMAQKVLEDIEMQKPFLDRYTTCEQKKEKWRNIHKQMKIEKEKE